MNTFSFINKQRAMSVEVDFSNGSLVSENHEPVRDYSTGKDYHPMHAPRPRSHCWDCKHPRSCAQRTFGLDTFALTVVAAVVFVGVLVGITLLVMLTGANRAGTQVDQLFQESNSQLVGLRNTHYIETAGAMSLDYETKVRPLLSLMEKEGVDTALAIRDIRTMLQEGREVLGSFREKKAELERVLDTVKIAETLEGAHRLVQFFNKKVAQLQSALSKDDNNI